MATPDGGTIVITGDTIQIISDSVQGPPGPVGPTGAAVSTITINAGGIALSGHRAMRIDNAGLAAYADSATLAHANTVIGMSMNAASPGAPVTVQVSGEVTEPSWTWTPGLPVFCGPGGSLTQTPPSAGFQLILGIAKASTVLVVGIKQPIIII